MKKVFISVVCLLLLSISVMAQKFNKIYTNEINALSSNKTVTLKDTTIIDGVQLNGVVSFYTSNTGLTFNDTLYFNKHQRTYNDFTVSASFTIQIKSTGKIKGETETVTLIGDGTHTVTFSNVILDRSSPTFDNTNLVKNQCTFFYDGTDVWCKISQQ